MENTYPNISRLFKLLNISMSRQTQSEVGTLKDISQLFEPTALLQDIVDTTLPLLMEKNYKMIRKNLQEQSNMNLSRAQFIAELVLNIKKMILKDKFKHSKIYIQIMKCLRTLEAGSILKDLHSSSLLKKLSVEISNKLLSLTKIDSPDSHLTSLDGCLSIMEHQLSSQMNLNLKHPNKNLLKICCPLSMFFRADKTEKENINKLELKTKKIRKKKKQPVKFNETKQTCDFIIVKKINNINFGRICRDLVIDDSHVCKKHLNKKTDAKYTLVENFCQHILVQSHKKGMLCGDFIYESNGNKLYCKNHIKRHPINNENDSINNENDSNNNENCLRTFKVRIYPSTKQKKLLKCYFGCARFTYNKCVENKVTDIFKISRDKYVTNLPNDYDFLRETPKEIRAFAVKEYVTGITTANKIYKERINQEKYKVENYDNYTEKPITKYEMKYRKKSNSQSITIPKDSVSISKKGIKMYATMFGKKRIKFIGRAKKDKKLKELLKNNYVNHDIKIIKTITNKYYACFSIDVKKMVKGEPIKSCASDPGCNTLSTIFSQNKIIEIGQDMPQILKVYIENRNKLQKKYNERLKQIKLHPLSTYTFYVKTAQYKEDKKKYRLAVERLDNIINDIQNKAITKLKEYDVILYPILNTKKIVEQKDFSKKLKDIAQAEKHGQLRKKLADKCELNGTRLIIVSEHLSTQMCSSCFTRNACTGRVYTCKNCQFVHGRDMNASKNIYMFELIKQIIIELFS